MKNSYKYKIEIVYVQPAGKQSNHELVMRNSIESGIELSRRELNAIAEKWSEELPSAIETVYGPFIMEDDFYHYSVDSTVGFNRQEYQPIES